MGQNLGGEGLVRRRGDEEKIVDDDGHPARIAIEDEAVHADLLVSLN